MAHGPVDYYPDGSMKSVGSDHVSHYPEGNPKAVGDQPVGYYDDGSIKSIGDDRVEYYDNGVIKSIGGRSVSHYPDGSLKSVSQPNWPSAPSGGGSGGAEALLAFFTFLIVFWLAAMILSVVAQLVGALVQAYADLARRHPRAMLVWHLLLGMVAVGGGLALAGFDRSVQYAGVLLVPGLWAWQWLTARAPLVLMPINAALAGAGLWIAAQLTRAGWQPAWSRLTVGLTPLADLSNVLAITPMALLLWNVAARRWPAPFALLNQLVLGALLWFGLVRVWPDWIPLYREWTAPIPFWPTVGWVVFLAPIALWLWHKGQSQWPAPFSVFNLLVLGGLLGLTAYHAEPAWIASWRHWTAGLFIETTPIPAIALSPALLYGWNWTSRRWARLLVIPNLILTAGILYLLLDRTREYWISLWAMVWGTALPMVDLALIVPALPIVAWLWTQATRRWPVIAVPLSNLVWGGILWWMAVRTRVYWENGWRDLAGATAPDLALVVGLALPALWLWSCVQHRWVYAGNLVALAFVSAALFWFLGRVWPNVTLLVRTGLASLPVLTSALLFGSNRWTIVRRLGLVVTVLMVAAAGLGLWLAPSLFQTWLVRVLNWSAGQGVPVSPDLYELIRWN